MQRPPSHTKPKAGDMPPWSSPSRRLTGAARQICSLIPEAHAVHIEKRRSKRRSAAARPPSSPVLLGRFLHIQHPTKYPQCPRLGYRGAKTTILLFCSAVKSVLSALNSLICSLPMRQSVDRTVFDTFRESLEVQRLARPCHVLQSSNWFTCRRMRSATTVKSRV